MTGPLPSLFLARHGETTWSLSGQHTGLTDLPLTERGESNARRLGERLAGRTFARVLASPLQRAWRTAELAGFDAEPEPALDLLVRVILPLVLALLHLLLLFLLPLHLRPSAMHPCRGCQGCRHVRRCPPEHM